MEKLGRRAFLYDFYGELLTEHQKSVYEDVVLNDMSLTEIADDLGISRQGVHDLVKRCDKILAGYEEKLHLVERFLMTKEHVKRIRDISESYDNREDTKSIDEIMAEISQISSQILEEL